jgi:hypothetical protein
VRALVLHDCDFLEMGVEMLKGDLCPDCGVRAGDVAPVDMCVCGHPKARHFIRFYNCGECSDEHACTMYEAAE